ncbi:MAG: hypothetical protein HY741_02330 [Chloroflexi bacterium]|nr:hypothetical protein [Chloroflexota bacterium]
MASLNSSVNEMQEALKRLLQQWEAARQVWADSVSRDFQEHHLEPLDTQTRAAQREMEKVAQVIAQARKSVK